MLMVFHDPCFSLRLPGVVSCVLCVSCVSCPLCIAVADFEAVLEQFLRATGLPQRHYHWLFDGVDYGSAQVDLLPSVQGEGDAFSHSAMVGVHHDTSSPLSSSPLLAARQDTTVAATVKPTALAVWPPFAAITCRR